MRPILTITLNPALDIDSAVERLDAGIKLRCSAPRFDPGGGGINVSRAILELGGTSRALVALGGATGAQLEELLRKEGVELDAVRLAGETRFSFNVTERASGRQFRFVLPGPASSAADGDALLVRIEQRLRDLGDGFAVASGSLPPGLPDDFYARLAASPGGQRARLIVDTSGAALRAMAHAHVHMLVVGLTEARTLIDGADYDLAAAAALADRLLRQGAAGTVVLTLGPAGVLAATEGERLHVRPPEVEVRSAVGAGDSLVAAMTLGLARGWGLADAARYGAAAATAAVTTEATQLCRRDDTERYFRATEGHVTRL